MKYNSFSFIPCRGSTFLPTLFLLLFVLNIRSVICTYIDHTCDKSSTFTDGSTYSINLNLVIEDLLLNAPQSSGFNTSSRGQSPNKVYGLLQCTGNISAVRCSTCVVEANSSIHERCPNDIDTSGNIWLSTNSISGEAFKSTTSSLLSNLSNKAYIPANKGFAAGSANYSGSRMIFGLVQCWRDISIQDCRSCLLTATTAINNSSYQGAQVLKGSCKVRYEIYPFLNSDQSASPSPEGSTPNTSTPSASTPAPPPANGTSSKKSKSTSFLSLSLWVCELDTKVIEESPVRFIMFIS